MIWVILSGAIIVLTDVAPCFKNGSGREKVTVALCFGAGMALAALYALQVNLPSLMIALGEWMLQNGIAWPK